jgi:hypothetical protein
MSPHIGTLLENNFESPATHFEFRCPYRSPIGESLRTKLESETLKKKALESEAMDPSPADWLAASTANKSGGSCTDPVSGMGNDRSPHKYPCMFGLSIACKEYVCFDSLVVRPSRTSRDGDGDPRPDTR